MQLYISKLNPKSDAFFQYPKKQWNYDNDVWCDARPIGVNKLDNMTKSFSEAAKLSKMYTNHSVRATAIILWSNAGIQNRHIGRFYAIKTLKLSKTLKSSRDDFNVLDNFNVSSIKTANMAILDGNIWSP